MASENDLLGRITVNPHIFGGKPLVREAPGGGTCSGHAGSWRHHRVVVRCLPMVGNRGCTRLPCLRTQGLVSESVLSRSCWKLPDENLAGHMRLGRRAPRYPTLVMTLSGAEIGIIFRDDAYTRSGV